LIRLEERLDEFQGSVLDEVGQVPQNVKTLLLENFDINGVRPLTTADITTMLSSMEERLLNQIQRGGAPCPIEHTATPTTPTNQLHLFTWGNKFHRLPEDFKTPRVNVKTFWDLWWEGQSSDGIPPYRFFNRSDFAVQLEYSTWIKGKKGVQALLDNERNVSNMNQSERELFSRSAFRLCARNIIPIAVRKNWIVSELG
jgi:hypothetical protein